MAGGVLMDDAPGLEDDTVPSNKKARTIGGDIEKLDSMEKEEPTTQRGAITWDRQGEADAESYEDVEEVETEEEDTTSDDNDGAIERQWPVVPMTKEEKLRIRKPWRNSLILKVLGRTVSYNFLTNRLKQLWGITNGVKIIDLGNDFYIAKFSHKADMMFVLEGGPWIVVGHYVSLRKWKPGFVAATATVDTVTAWVRLPDLPIEYFDSSVLTKAGNLIGRTLKVDSTTETLAEGKFARMCIEIDLKKPLLPKIVIGRHTQRVEYEGLELLCFQCGRFGHRKETCASVSESNTVKNTNVDAEKVGDEMGENVELNSGPDHGSQKVICLTTNSSLPVRSTGVVPENFRSGDVIHEFSVDEPSPSSAWEMVLETPIGACQNVYGETGSFRFGCKHSVEGDHYLPESFDSLSKFCYSANPMNNIPGSILSTKELDASCKVLSKWIQLDRFGLDMGFVQELIEQLPGVTSCSNYQSLSKRIHSSALQTVGSGVLLAKRKSDKKVDKEPDSLIQSCRRPNLSGKQLSSKLPQKLIGDVLRVCDFFLRFSEVLELGEPFSLPEIEDELINPWLDAEKSLKKSDNEIEYDGIRSSCNGSGENDLTSSPSNASFTKFHSEDSSEVITMEVGSMTDPSRADLASNTHNRCIGAILASSHTSLLKVVIGELLSKVAAHVKPNFDSGESKTRQGKKKYVENSVTSKKTKLDVLPVNELTWPELARRYILAVLSMDDNLDFAEMTCAETTRASVKVFHCLQGDGGMICGSFTGVAAMEADAVLLAEASKKIFGSTRSKNDVFSIVQKESDPSSPKAINMTDDVIPEWAQALEPIRKLPTNVGSRIRNCIYKALEKNPPEWAEEILKRSISNAVYKGNASGPTKRLVLSVLTRVAPEDPKLKPDKKEKGRNVKTLSDIIMKQCRIMLRHAFAADEDRVFCNLLGRTLGNDDKGLLGYPAMVCRPLDFRIIDLRLTAGAYGGSHEAFIEDIREVWHNIRIAYGERPELADLAETLSQKFENLYEDEVLALVRKVTEIADPNLKSEELKDEVDCILARISESSLPKAPWEDGVCKVCVMDEDDDSVLLCDRCDSEYHTYCLDPPLARIPDGNWYCPSCAASQIITQDGLCGTRLIRQGGKRRLQREFSQITVETLAHLADMMELKEYWELTLEERVFLLKYLCDEALSSSVICDHLDNCASVSVDNQSKLRSLTSELKHLMLREDILVANSSYGESAPELKAFSCDRENAKRSDFPLTKANTLLAKMYGSCLEQGTTEISKSQSSRAKVTCESRLDRCECLELVWPSRHHCLLCHQTFGTAEDLEEHKTGKCKLVSPVPESFNDASASSLKNKGSLLGIDKLRIICQSSLRPLVGKVTEILRQLKLNLLDMEAALPEEALRPSRTTSEKRCLWREFVKSAVSIYEMIQATVVFEDMIKTEYLRNEWWYWSSPAAAAKVSTVSALALRIYSLDAAIVYEKSLSSVDTAEETSARSSRIENKTSRNPKNNPEPSSPPLAVTFNMESSAESSKPKTRRRKRIKDSAESSKPETKQSKRRKDSAESSKPETKQSKRRKDSGG